MTFINDVSDRIFVFNVIENTRVSDAGNRQKAISCGYKCYYLRSHCFSVIIFLI
ncbi:MAG: hypothetical protein WBA93_05095 [Microcoleaceae cyanobacterium]